MRSIIISLHGCASRLIHLSHSSSREMRPSKQLSFERSILRQVSALTDCGGEAQYVRFAPLPRPRGKKRKEKKSLKTEGAATLPAEQLHFDSQRVSAEVSSNFIIVCCCFVFIILFVRHGSAPFPVVGRRRPSTRLRRRQHRPSSHCVKYCKLSQIF